jgi:hypothetical protein
VDDFTPRTPTEPGTWDAVPDLDALRKRARTRAGVNPANDPYTAFWGDWLNDAREEVLQRLAGIGGGHAPTEVAFRPSAAGMFDLAPYGILRVDRVGLVDATDPTDITWLPWLRPEAAFTGLTEQTGTPTGAYRAGGTLFGLSPIPDASTLVVVQGAMLPRPMVQDSDSARMVRDAMEAVALGAAVSACLYDISDEPMQKRLPLLQSLYQKALWDLKLACLQRFPAVQGHAASFGYGESDGVSGARWTRDASGPLAPSQPVPAPPVVVTPAMIYDTVAVAPTPGTTTVVATLPVVALPGAVWAVSAQQGAVGCAASTDRLTLTATLAVNPDTGDRNTFTEGDIVTFYYPRAY